MYPPAQCRTHYSNASADKTLIADYFGNTTAGGGLDYTSSASTFGDATNPNYRQQRILAILQVPLCRAD